MKQIRALSVFVFMTLIVASVYLHFSKRAAADGYSNQILEVTGDGSPIKAYAGPGISYGEYETLLWGDRVLWLGTAQSDGSQNWLQVFLGDGHMAWVPDNPGALLEVNPVYTTPGARVGEVLHVLPEGDQANLRELPSTYVDRVQYIQEGETLEIIGGPYQAEFQIWWQVRAPNGATGWLIDVAGWYATSAGG